jgi:hypothetical protein
MSRTGGYDKIVSTENDEKYKQYLKVLEEGRNTIYKILNTNNATDNNNKNQVFNLNLNNLNIQNFGPYGGDKVFYPLSKRCIYLYIYRCLYFCMVIYTYRYI